MNSLLDVARQTYKEANTDAADLAAELVGQYIESEKLLVANLDRNAQYSP